MLLVTNIFRLLWETAVVPEVGTLMQGALGLGLKSRAMRFMLEMKGLSLKAFFDTAVWHSDKSGRGMCLFVGFRVQVG